MPATSRPATNAERPTRPQRQPHPESCPNCKHCWYHSPESGEGGSSGWVCDGRNGAQNLKSFPFLTKQPCFEGPKAKA